MHIVVYSVKVAFAGSLLAFVELVLGSYKLEFDFPNDSFVVHDFILSGIGWQIHRQAIGRPGGLL